MESELSYAFFTLDVPACVCGSFHVLLPSTWHCLGSPMSPSQGGQSGTAVQTPGGTVTNVQLKHAVCCVVKQTTLQGKPQRTLFCFSSAVAMESLWVRAVCPLWGWALLHAQRATPGSTSLGSKLGCYWHIPLSSPLQPSKQAGVLSEKQENCSGTDMKTKGMVSKLDIKKYAKINCGRQVKILRNNILTTTFQENCSKVNTCSNTFSHPSDSQVGSQKMWLALFH